MIRVPRGASRETHFRVALQGDVWAVTKNEVFYGDYHSREQAIRGACFGARAVEATGGLAHVLAGPDGEVVDHGDPDPRP